MAPSPAQNSPQSTPSEPTEDDWTLVHEFLHHCREGNLQIVKQLVDFVRRQELPEEFASDQKPNAPYPYTIDTLLTGGTGRSTALHHACANGQVAVARYLAEELHSKCVANDAGNTPLHWACQNGHTETVKWLLSQYNELDVDQKNSYGRSAVGLAYETEVDALVECLLEHSLQWRVVTEDENGGGLDEESDEENDDHDAPPPAPGATARKQADDPHR